MSKLIFKPEDFECVVPKIGQTDESALACESQRIHDSWLEKQPVVKGSGHSEDGSFVWFERTVANGFYTHQARLVCIEEIKKCEHPNSKVKLVQQGQPFYRNHEEWSRGAITSEYFYQCECGAKVRPKEFEEVT